MDRIHTTDITGRWGIDSRQDPEEREVASYLNELISTILAEKDPENAVRGRETNRPPAKELSAAGEPPAEPESATTPRHPPRARGANRASMRDDLQELFSDPKPLPPDAAIAPYLGATTASVERGPGAPRSCAISRKSETWSHPSPAPAPSGLDILDKHLGGGFSPGLHLVTGRTASGKTAFLESVGWTAIAAGRPVLYYTFEHGVLRTRDRLLGSLVGLMNDPSITLEAIRDHTLSASEFARFRSIERTLQTAVLAHMSLIDDVPVQADMFEAFVDDVRVRSLEAERERGSAPLVLIDDAVHLARATRVRPLADLLGRLNDVFTADSITGLVTVQTPKKAFQAIHGLPARTAISLTRSTSLTDDTVEYVDLVLLTGTCGRWTGVIPLLFDRHSGVFVPRE